MSEDIENLPVESKMVNVVSSSTADGNVLISVENARYYYLPFDKSPLDLSDPKIRDKFIKGVEKNVRTSKIYKRYIDYLKREKGLNHCAVFGNIESAKKGGKTKIEMHHGPIFTLYDIASIVLEKHLSMPNPKINTFDIAEEVLDLHRRNLVQVVMLSQTVHKSMDNKEKAPFITMDMTWGNLMGFIEEYGQYFSPQHRSNLKKYIVNYQKNLETKKLNMFTPNITKYNIKVVNNKWEIPK
jgi:hypothetical protein